VTSRGKKQSLVPLKMQCDVIGKVADFLTHYTAKKKRLGNKILKLLRRRIKEWKRREVWGVKWTGRRHVKGS